MTDAARDQIPGTALEFEAFLAAHYDGIHAYAYRALGNRQDAEDVTQDVCMALPAKLRGFRGDSSIRTWLYRIVTNAAIDKMRKRRTELRAAQGWQDMLSTAAEEGRDRVEALEWLAEAMKALPDDLRVTMALLVEKDMTQAQAAEVLDIAPGTVAWRMSEIKRHLRQLAEERENG